MSIVREKTRVRILDTAARLLAERGFHGVGLEEVARSAGVSRQTVYLHFSSKSELLVAMAQYVDERVGVPELIRQIFESRTALEALDQGIRAYATIEPRIYEAARTIYDARRSDPAADAAWRDRMAYRRLMIGRIVERLAREGLLSQNWNVDEAADFAWALLSLHTYEYLVVEQRWPIERFVDRLQTVLLRVLIDPSVS